MEVEKRKEKKEQRASNLRSRKENRFHSHRKPVYRINLVSISLDWKCVVSVGLSSKNMILNWQNIGFEYWQTKFVINEFGEHLLIRFHSCFSFNSVGKLRVFSDVSGQKYTPWRTSRHAQQGKSDEKTISQGFKIFVCQDSRRLLSQLWYNKTRKVHSFAYSLLLGHSREFVILLKEDIFSVFKLCYFRMLKHCDFRSKDQKSNYSYVYRKMVEQARRWDLSFLYLRFSSASSDLISCRYRLIHVNWSIKVEFITSFDYVESSNTLIRKQKWRTLILVKFFITKYHKVMLVCEIFIAV